MMEDYSRVRRLFLFLRKSVTCILFLLAGTRIIDDRKWFGASHLKKHHPPVPTYPPMNMSFSS